MTTSPEQWRRAEAIFVDAQERQGAARRAFLDQACGDDAALRQEVESLLDADEATGAFLDEPLRASPSVLDEPLPIGAQVGRYRLLELLGEGGMGQVFLAERADGAYEQQVALKLIKPDMAIETLRQRFRQERQALAQLQHPGIARILDGGETDDGWPYLVMEYVDGLPIDRDCAQRQRSLDERLSMFRRICDAVHAAHRNLIVHRDLKPSNILVTAAGAPVLLDFGIAKLLAQDHNRPDITRTGGRPMTPRWASPEQVMGDPTTTAMDVYSLGAILYFLLAGAPPYHDAPEAAITQAVLRGAPPPPSAVAADPARRRRVSGDLDAIVARALHRDPQQRYATVEHLADDLLRHLGSLPVQARPATLAYRTRCYLRRNRVLVGAGVLTAASLAGGLALSWMQYRRAFAAEAQARARFAQVREMGRDLVFDVHRQIAPLPGSAPAQRVVLERGTQYLASLRPDPTADPQLALDVADGYRRLARLWSSSFNVSLGSPVEAARALDRSAELYDALLARDPTNATAWAGRIRCETQRADVHLAQRHAADGHATALRALAMGPPAIHSQADVRSARYQAAMQAAIAAREIGKPNEGLELLVRARELGAALPEAGPADPAFLGTRGTILAKIGHFDAAIDSTRGALALLQRQHAGTPGDLRTEIRIAALQTSLGQILLSARRGNEAREPLSAALPVQRRRFEIDPANRDAHRDLVVLVNRLGNLAIATGNPRAAVKHWNEARDLLRGALGRWPDDPELQAQLANVPVKLAQAWLTAGDFAQTETEARAAMASLGTLLEQQEERYPVRANHAAAQGMLGHALISAGRVREAEATMVSYHAAVERMVDDYPDLADPRRDLLYATDALARLHRELADEPDRADRGRRRNLQRAQTLWTDCIERARGLVDEGLLPEERAELPRLERSIADCQAQLAAG